MLTRLSKSQYPNVVLSNLEILQTINPLREFPRQKTWEIFVVPWKWELIRCRWINFRPQKLWTERRSFEIRRIFYFGTNDWHLVLSSSFFQLTIFGVLDVLLMAKLVLHIFMSWFHSTHIVNFDNEEILGFMLLQIIPSNLYLFVWVRNIALFGNCFVFHFRAKCISMSNHCVNYVFIKDVGFIWWRVRLLPQRYSNFK